MTTPPEAITTAEQAIRARYTITGPDVDRRIASVMGEVRTGLEAAAPLITAAERDRIRQPGVAERIGDTLATDGLVISTRNLRRVLDALADLLRAEP